ncbi:retrograde regulation protein 2 [Annulohypoxylon truncatum]|uniref:retrograde regulation protein 2 n=1 Tax=Annulohypoxylon truncatum TaxID=327061 RepID=UPI002008AE73|nr:retrograde regulation protein 2 [Annulohypoxylon truncatum]KAI1206324.1 retrograde regulation protein 2 [Annulohypoxylon truncatum]
MAALSRISEYFRGGPISALEKKLIFKMDFFILTFCCLAYFMNYLDRASVSQAYVSGMKEDLHFVGAQLTEVTTLYSVGYLLGIIPNNMLLTYFKPGRFFPFMILVWASLTMINAAAKRPQHLMAIRFFQGYAESCIFAGTHYILGSWYTEKELGKRSALFTASGLAGGMFGGFLQTGIYSSMNGLAGLEGWRWLYIIDGIITIPVAIYGYFLFPDVPATTTAVYFNEEERQLAKARVPVVEGARILSTAFIKQVFTSWYFYGFCFLWILGNCSESLGNQSLMNLYLQDTVYQLNNYPTGVQAVGIVSTLLWAFGTDILGRRWSSGYFVSITAICVGILLLVPNMSTAGQFAAYYWSGTIYCIQATFFAWANDSMRHQPPTLRAVIIACMNFSGNLFQAWWPLIFYRANDAPKFTKGMCALIGVGAAMGIWVTVMLYLERHHAKKHTDIIDAVDAAEAGSSCEATHEIIDGTGGPADLLLGLLHLCP